MDAEAGRAYVTRWICPSRQPRPGDVAILQRTGSRDNGVFAKGMVTSEPFENDNGIRVVSLRLDSFLPVGEEIPREEIVATANYQRPWMPMASGNVVPEPLHEAIQTLWIKRTSSKSPVVVGTLSPDHGVSPPKTLEGLAGEPLQQVLLVAGSKRNSVRTPMVSRTVSMNGGTSSPLAVSRSARVSCGSFAKKLLRVCSQAASVVQAFRHQTN